MQDRLAPQVVADLDVFLMFVGGVVVLVVAFGSKKKWPDWRMNIANGQPNSAAATGS